MRTNRKRRRQSVRHTRGSFKSEEPNPKRRRISSCVNKKRPHFSLIVKNGAERAKTGIEATQKTAKDLMKLRAILNKKITAHGKLLRSTKRNPIEVQQALNDLIKSYQSLKRSMRDLLSVTDEVNIRQKKSLFTLQLDTERIEALLKSKVTAACTRGVSCPGSRFLDPKLNIE